MIKQTKFDREIAAGLDKAFHNKHAIKDLDPVTLNHHNSARYIIFSDQHRGVRNGADDFQRSERAYNAALAYYNALGYHMIALGDVEELWEERASSVLPSYAHTLDLERRFHEDGRYHRAFGNHDDIWQYPQQVARWLQPRFGEKPLKVYEGFRMPVSTDQETIGQFFLVHGHQGTKDSDKWAWFSKPFVRYVWQPFQRLTRYRLTTPATDWQMRKAHNVAMYRWAQAQQENLVLITGHTHYPVFASKTHELQLLDEIKMVQAGSGLKGMDKRKKLAELAAKLEWVRAQQSQGQKEAVENEDMKPCYFNTGCCSFSDGDVTGLEIADNEIRLVRWPGEDGAATLKILARASLAGVFARLHPDQAQNEMEGTLAIFEDMLADAMLKSLSTM